MSSQPSGLDPITSAPSIELPSIHGIRRENLGALLQSFSQAQLAAGMPPKGLEQAFAAQLQISPSMLSQIKRNRNISDSLARQIERLSGKEDGWLSRSLQLDAVAHTTSTDDQDITEDKFEKLAQTFWALASKKHRQEVVEAMLASLKVDAT